MTTTDDLIKNFELLGDWDARYQYIIDLGKKLPEMPEEEKTDETFMKGCGSNVWVNALVTAGPRIR
jgi:cysteine desulfuration protein SufE